MRKSIKIGLVCLSLLAVNFLSAQVTRQNQWSGVPCTDCATNSQGSTEKGGSNTVQNGNGTIATSYTVTQCGLGFTTASVRLNRRSFSFTPAQGVLQPATMAISGIPACRTIVKAFLYVGGSGNGVAITANIVNPALATNSYPMTLIGSHVDKCWGYSGTHNYRADVTSCITGNGNYVLSGIPCLGATPNDMDGATLIIIYSDPSQTFTGHMVIGDGCREVSGGTITNNITGFNVCGAVNPGSTQNFVIVSDLQRIANTPINLNSATANYTFPSASNNVWDYIQQPGAPAVAGQTSATYGFSNASDCYNFVAAGMYYRTACQLCSSPALTITPVTTSSCSAGSATANVVGGTGPYTYTWSPTGGNAQSVSSVPTGNYTVSVTDATGCNVGTATIAINAASGPTITANSPTICAGSSANITAAGALTYTWSPGATLNTTTGPNVVATPPSTQVYSISGTNAVGCVSTITTQVLVNPMPVPVVGSNSPVCLNSPINLTAAGGTTYSWSGPNLFSSALQNPTVPAATAVNAGVYTVTVTSLGCSTSGTVNVAVVTPTTSASNTGPYCAGATIQLNAPAATSYTWTGPAFNSNLQSPTIGASTAAMSGNYTILVSIGTCTATATTSVTVNALPSPAATNTGPYCPGTTIQLNVGAFSTYTWTGPAFNSNQQNPTIPSAVVAHTGNYVVTVTDANGCINTSNTNVLVNPTPAITVNNPGTCVNQTINLTATGGNTYAWTGPLGFTSALQNPSIPTAVLGMSGPYTVLATSAAGCTNTAVSNVTVYPLPNPNITSNSPVCAGGTLNLFGTGGAIYAWSGPGYVGANQNPTIPNVTAAANGVYTLLVSSGTCTASITHTVVINPVPVFSFAGSNVLCNGQSNGTSTVNVTVGTSPFNYQWTTSPMQTSQVASNIPAGTYSCTVTDANGCSSISSTQITQPTQFSVSISSATLSACANTPINVNAIGAGGTGPYSYNWVSGPSTGAYSVNEALSGNYMYVVNAVDAFNCPATANINLTFFPLPNVNASSATICSGQTTSLIATGATSYVWQPGSITGSTYPFSGNTSVNVSVVGTANGCSNTATASVNVNPNPTANINTGTANGCVPTCVEFNAANSSAGIASYNWILNGAGITGSVNGAYCFDEAASYTLGLTVFDGNGCTSTITPVTITIHPQPIADFNHAPIKPIVNQDPFVTFTDASYNATIVSWNWYFMNTAQYTSIEQNPTFGYLEPGTYPVVLVVKSDFGCVDTLVRPLVVMEDFGIYAPNAFTPNGDGLNDIFQPKGFGVVDYELNIYDRWGEKVFSTKKFEEGWDGKFMGRKGDIIEEGTYTWLINCTSVFGKSHELKGHVTLIR
ncbi:MAG: gliding motility-associated C-terminal domain-containing protein [Sphingobacteriaceae bacterium]|nr:gliding motility-associated C-terminal domain-containing protein [Sphingobacteriaceae bacterium]